MTLLQGRTFDYRDAMDTSLVAIVNQTFVSEFWDGQSPLGKHIHRSGSAHGYRVIGVLRDEHHGGWAG